MNSVSEKDRRNVRTPIRYTCANLKAKMETASGAAEVLVSDISLEGIGAYCEGELNLPSDKAINLWLSSEKLGESDTIKVFCVGKSEKTNGDKKSYIYHLKFVKPQRPEKLGVFNLFFSVPSHCPETTRQRFELQKTLAEKDIEALENSNSHLKGCQFQLVLSSMPILFGILSALISFVTGTVKTEVHPLYYFLPPVSVVLSLTFLAVFIQKTEAIRRATAFSLILQRHLAMGSLPPCYRGWHDAYENYNHFVRHGAEKKSVFDVPEFSEKKVKHRVPADSFTWLAVILFLFTPAASMILMFLVLANQISKDPSGVMIYGVIVCVATLFLVGSALWFFRKFKALSHGKRSFRYLVVLFSKIIKYAPPFDPYKNDPINVYPNPPK